MWFVCCELSVQWISPNFFNNLIFRTLFKKHHTSLWEQEWFFFPSLNALRAGDKWTPVWFESKLQYCRHRYNTPSRVITAECWRSRFAGRQRLPCFRMFAWEAGCVSQRGLQILLLNDSVLVVADTPEVTAHRCRAGTATSEVDCVSPDTHPGVDCVTWRLRERRGLLHAYACCYLTNVMWGNQQAMPRSINVRNWTELQK